MWVLILFVILSACFCMSVCVFACVYILVIYLEKQNIHTAESVCVLFLQIQYV